jgi:hypothetical protein
MPGLYKPKVWWDRWEKRTFQASTYDEWCMAGYPTEEVLDVDPRFTLYLAVRRYPVLHWGREASFRAFYWTESHHKICTPLGVYYSFIFRWQYDLTKAHLASPSVKREEHMVRWHAWRTERKEVQAFFTRMVRPRHINL